MSEKSNARRIAALMLAMMFTFVTIISAASVPTYAAAKTPAKVAGVKATAKSTTSIKVTWKKAKYAKKYQVYRATSKTGKYKKVKTTAKLYFTNKSLKSGKKYFYKVRAINGTKKGKFSKIKYATTKKKSTLDKVTVDTANKSVTINAKVNGKYFKESTRHLIVDSKGFNAGKSILTSYCSPDALYNALVKVGGVSWSSSEDAMLKNGEKITKQNAENANYSHMDITISWGSESHDLGEVLTKEQGNVKPLNLDMVFSGNPKAAAKTPSGCVVCLDSCYIGMVSNCKYGLCDIDNKNPACYADADVLPADGTVVQVTFTLK